MNKHVQQHHNKLSFFLALCVAFIDYIGIGLTYPLFSAMLFESSNFVSASTSHEMRGILLGILIGLMPFAQFFSAPIWGAISDAKGRKKPLVISITIGLLGYIVSLFGVVFHNIYYLFISRLILGFAAGNMSIVQAVVADLTSHQEKAKNFGLFGMSLGIGFTLGPFFGGTLSKYSLTTPFLFASVVVALNLVFTLVLFRETHHLPSPRKLHWTMGLKQLKKAFHLKGIRGILFSSFLHNFAWSYFFEFVPVYLITSFHFTSVNLGYFYGVSGALYALSTGILIRPFIKHLKPETLFFGGNLLTALLIMIIPFVPSIAWLWPVLVGICFTVAFVTPTCTTVISNSAPSQIQGEALGILSSVNAAALFLSPLLAGLIVGKEPKLSMFVGGMIMLIAALVVLIIFKGHLFKRR